MMHRYCFDHLEKELQKDAGAKGSVLVDKKDQLSVIYFFSSQMRELSDKLPEIGLVDGTQI